MRIGARERANTRRRYASFAWNGRWLWSPARISIPSNWQEGSRAFAGWQSRPHNRHHGQFHAAGRTGVTRGRMAACRRRIQPVDNR